MPHRAHGPWLRAVVVWLGIMGAEVIHGMLRTMLLAPVVGDFRARQISVFTGSLLIVWITWLFIDWLRVPTTRGLLATGGAWVVLTVAFEMVLGRVVFGYSWERLASDYDLRRGGFLAVGLLVLALSPLVAARLRGSRRSSRREVL